MPSTEKVRSLHKLSCSVRRPRQRRDKVYISICRNVPAVWPGSFECMFRNNGNLRRAIVLKTHRILLHYEIYELSDHLFVKVVFLFIFRRVKMNTQEKESVILKDYDEWYASGRGLKGHGRMSLVLEKVNQDTLKVVDWNAKTKDPMGYSSGMYINERKYFEEEFKKAEGLEFTFDEKTLPILEWHSSQFKKVIDYMNKYGIKSMHLTEIDEKLAALYPEHRGMSVDSPDSVLYNPVFLRPCILPKTDIDIFYALTLSGQKISDISEIKFPSNFKFDKLDVGFVKTYPEDLKNIKVSRVCFDERCSELPQDLLAENVRVMDKNHVKIPKGWNVDNLDLDKCSNVIIEGAKINSVAISGCSNVIISDKAKIKQINFSEYGITPNKNILIPTSVKEIEGVAYQKFYLYDKTPEDKVLVDKVSKPYIESRAGLVSGRSDYVQNAAKNNSSLYTKEEVERHKKAKEMINDHKGIKAIAESHEEVDNKSNDLKALYEETAKTSGVVKADVLAMAKIVEGLWRR